MRILIISIIDLVNSAPQRPHHFIKHLAKKNDITVICPNDYWKGKQVDSNKYYKGENEYLKGVDIRYITLKKMSPIMQELLSPFLLSLKNEDKFDVIFNYNTLISGKYLANKLNIPMVYDLADDLPAMIAHSPQIPKALKSFGESFGEFLLKCNIKNSIKVTCTSRSLQEVYQIPEEKFELVPNGVNTDLFHPMLSDVRGQYNLNGNLVLGYVGMLREWVDLEPVYKAMKSLENVKLFLVGEEGQIQENRDLVKSYGIEQDVIFVGTVPYADIPQYIAAMDVCLIPFKNNGISQNAVPLKLFEYMACGKPVVSTKLKGVYSIVKNLIYYAETNNEYLIIFQKIIEGEKSEIVSDENRNFVMNKFNWPVISENLETILEESV